MAPAPSTPPTSRTARAALPRRVMPGGFSALLLLAVTVQLSLAMLEWGPASDDTRQRLATTIVAAAHRGVFTEPARAERPKGPDAGDRPDRGGALLARATVDPARGELPVPWVSAVPPPHA